MDFFFDQVEANRIESRHDPRNPHSGTVMKKCGMTKHFLTGLTDMFTPLFAGMMDKGLLRKDDPAMLAFAYTTPISSLIHLCDREREKTGEAMAQVEAFSRHFIKIYGNGVAHV